ncbi:hypothetical protein RB195_011487 [Necator americanus]|uniref:Uncharacterized protein n=1 Tax=Necator americanus TaxID=51031 RepID=A0ABR1D3Z8_NECAM
MFVFLLKIFSLLLMINTGESLPFGDNLPFCPTQFRWRDRLNLLVEIFKAAGAEFSDELYRCDLEFKARDCFRSYGCPKGNNITILISGSSNTKYWDYWGAYYFFQEVAKSWSRELNEMDLRKRHIGCFFEPGNKECTRRGTTRASEGDESNKKHSRYGASSGTFVAF